MASGPGQASSRAGGFWAVWQRLWWLFFLAFVAGSVWLWTLDRVLCIRLFGAVFLCFGVGSLLYGLRAVRLARVSESWPMADGVILSASIEQDSHTSEIGSHRDSYTAYYPAIEFEYRWQGRAHRSRRVLFANVSWPRTEAEALVASHPVGSHTAVYVDPKHPQTGVLRPGLEAYRGKYLVVFFVGGFLSIVGLAAILIAPLARR